MNELVVIPQRGAIAGFHQANLRGISQSWKRAVIVFGTFIAIFLIWMIAAPLSSAAIAPGVVEVDGRRRVVENLEGGIVSRLLVRDGQQVRKGQPLLILDTTRSSAEREAIHGDRLALLAERERLTAELRGGTIGALPPMLAEASDDARAHDLLARERAQLQSRRESLESQRTVFRETAMQARADVLSQRATIQSDEAQLRALKAELASVEVLVAEQLERRSRLFELQRNVAALEGQISTRRGAISRAERQVGEASARISTLEAGRTDENQARLREIMALLNTLTEREKAAADVSRRRVVTAPADGRVVELQVMTEGAVIQPGQRLMDVVPQRQELVILGRVRPIDIDRVHRGLTSEVRIVPYTGRDAQLLNGIVDDVSADAITTRDGTQTYYSVRVRITDKDVEAKGVSLVSGMPAEVYIKTGRRTLFAALIQPLTDSFRRGLRE